MEPLQLFWFILLGVLMAGYGILDGFDLGVGILHLCVRKDQERRLLMNSIGPLWDGNEVWLVVFGGAVFAAFPRAYAAAFSGFYLPFMLLLVALIFRAVSMEFRSKQEMPWWRSSWDVSFCLASTLAAFLFGVTVGNSIAGLPLGADGDFIDRVPLMQMLRPYPFLTGVFAVATFAMHGSIYLYLKTEGELQQRIRGWMWRTFFVFIVLYVLVSILTLTGIHNSTAKYRAHPWAWGVVLLNLLAIANIPRAIYTGRPFYAFISSSCTIAAFTFLFGLTLYPNMIVSDQKPAAPVLAASTVGLLAAPGGDAVLAATTAAPPGREEVPDWNLTVAKAASTDETLTIMTIIAFLGLPFVLTYTATIYWVFRGKVEIGKFSY